MKGGKRIVVVVLAVVAVVVGSAAAGASGGIQRVLTDQDIAAMSMAQRAALLNPLRRLASAVDTAGKAMVPGQYSGVALDPGHGTVDVYLTDTRLASSLLRQAVRVDPAANITLARVHSARYSQRALRAAADRLRPVVASLGIDSIAISPQGDALHVRTHRPNDPAGTASLIAQTTRISAVATLVEPGAPIVNTSGRGADGPPWIAGARIFVGYQNHWEGECTSGIPAIRYDGRPFLITAAHCSTSGNDHVENGDFSQVIGPVMLRDDVYDAIGIDTLDSGGTTGLEWDGPRDSSFTLPLDGVARSYLNDFVCHDGYVSAGPNEANGAVCDIKVTIPYLYFMGEDNVVHLGVQGTKVGSGNAVLDGDSGALVFAIANTSSRQVRGIVSGGTDKGVVPSVVYWTEASDIFSSFGLHLAPCCSYKSGGGSPAPGPLPNPGPSPGPSPGSPAVSNTRTAAPAIAMPDGSIEVFARGTNNHLIEFWYTAANGWNSSDKGGDIRDVPVAFPTAGGGIEVFARGGNNTLQEWWYTPANGWRSASQGGSIGSGPTAYYNSATGLIDVYARGTNNHLVEFWYTPANGWRSSDMGGSIADTPVALPTLNNGIEVFARGSNNTLQEWWYTPANGWRSASQGGSIASSPTAYYSSSTGLIDVYARGMNNHLVEFWYTPANGWRNFDMGGSIADTPVALPTLNNGVEVFARGADNTLQEWWYTPANGWRSASQGGSIASSPTAYYISSTGLIDIYARGTNNHLIEFWYTPTAGWQTSDKGGSLADV